MKKTKTKSKYTMIRVLMKTRDKFNYKRAKAVKPENPVYMTQDEFLNSLLDK